MSGIAYKEIMKNHRLTKFKETKELVIANAINNVPEVKRKQSKGMQSMLSHF